jgi:hypothetical protein
MTDAASKPAAPTLKNPLNCTGVADAYDTDLAGAHQAFRWKEETD